MVIRYKASDYLNSMWVRNERVSCSVWLLCRPVLRQAANKTHDLTVSATWRPEFICQVQPQQQCQFKLLRLCVTTLVNKGYQLKSVKVTLHSHCHSLTPSKYWSRIHTPWFKQHLRYVRSVVSLVDTTLPPITSETVHLSANNTVQGTSTLSRSVLMHTGNKG
jgi:hypothetical protein